jgi:hypothetical protein
MRFKARKEKLAYCAQLKLSSFEVSQHIRPSLAHTCTIHSVAARFTSSKEVRWQDKHLTKDIGKLRTQKGLYNQGMLAF